MSEQRINWKRILTWTRRIMSGLGLSAVVLLVLVLFFALVPPLTTDRSSIPWLWVLIPCLPISISAGATFCSEYASIHYQSKVRVASLAGCVLSVLLSVAGLVQIIQAAFSGCC